MGVPDTLSLVKAQALGNDFLLARRADLPAGIDRAGLARAACDRRHGIGADGFMTLEETRDGARTTLLNADGSASEVSGNGVRCAAAWLAHARGLAPGAQIVIGTDAGPKPLALLEAEGSRWVFRANMGQPEDLRLESLELGRIHVDAVVLRVGNPQCVVLGPATPERLHGLAAKLAVHPAFAAGTNVELATVEAPDRVRILIWERGVGPTEASGTGACAAAVAAAAYGGANRAVDIVAPGGVQRVEWTDDGIFLTGWASLTATIEWWMPPGLGV
jgi:diaminopimelate epimerase